MFEMIVPINLDAPNAIKEAVDEFLKMAEKDGYITTKTVFDILRPESVSDDLIVSELTWWSYEELNNHSILTFGEPIVRPGYVMVRFPQYHTGPYGSSSNETQQTETQYDVVSHPSHYTEGRKSHRRLAVKLQPWKCCEVSGKGW